MSSVQSMLVSSTWPLVCMDGGPIHSYNLLSIVRNYISPGVFTISTNLPTTITSNNAINVMY